MNQMPLETETEKEKSLSPAEKYYINHKKNVAKYQRANAEKCKIKNQRHVDKMRLENPETFDQLRLEYSRNYYYNIRKPKDMALRALNKLKEAEAIKSV
jgi:hypothetical protein